MKVSQTFKLLDLPDAALSVIIANLTDSDKKMIMAVCRKTFDMTMLNASITLKVAEGSKFAGFRKVVNLAFPASIHLVIMCPAGDAHHHVPSATSAVLMGMVPDKTLIQLAACKFGKAWQRITKVFIKGTMMRCLVPHFIALACPQLVQFKIEWSRCKAEVTNTLDIFNISNIFSSNPEQALPLTLCTSLKHLEFGSYRPKLPSSYHSPAELRQNLPNIDTLVFKEYHNASLIQAFATQLTRLEIHSCGFDMDEVQQVIRPLSNLQHLCVPELVLPDSSAHLTCLKVTHNMRDDHIQLLLQLPSLTELHLPEMCNIRKDWSHHACPWQTLCLDNICFEELCNLNLSSLKKLSVGADVAIYLPDPSDPSSLPLVQRIIGSLSHTQIEVNRKETKEIVHFGKSSAIYWGVLNCVSENEQNAAELIRVVAQWIGPSKAYNCKDLTNRPLPLVALLKWGQAFIESVCLGKTYDPQPFVWKALQDLDKLHTVAFWTHCGYSDDPKKWGGDAEILNIPFAISSAAHHYVIPANKSLRIEHGFWNFAWERAAVTETELLLRTAILEGLPAGCRLASLEYTDMAGNDQYSYDALVNAYWVAVVEPLTPTEKAAEVHTLIT